MTYHDRIKALRKEKGFTLKDVAKKLDVTEATAQRYESNGSGIKDVPYEKIILYAEMFNVDPAEIFGWETPTTPIDVALEKTNTDELVKLAMDERVMKYAAKLMKLSSFQQEMIFNNIDMFEQNNKGEEV